MIIDKQRFTAFYDTKLDLVLSRMDIKHLITFGAWTEACLETIRHRPERNSTIGMSWAAALAEGGAGADNYNRYQVNLPPAD
ncbi:isochorismatase family protein [Mesorhizobium sp.]|uniref:isochorismatase family protein n=1 Tax=Mesorhizobium sp. TaxID=1871066 RepID=UPI001224EB0D|nr:MAG: isochorismatase family protein [Mesorhizobium sp.]TIO64048.1 MAG: isochorismatase family protein [Mesorhizobium sp.]TJV88180.1 MAG: isochorismatase family protein [Mesorhizobium sp.]